MGRKRTQPPIPDKPEKHQANFVISDHCREQIDQIAKELHGLQGGAVELAVDFYHRAYYSGAPVIVVPREALLQQALRISVPSEVSPMFTRVANDGLSGAQIIGYKLFDKDSANKDCVTIYTTSHYSDEARIHYYDGAATAWRAYLISNSKLEATP